MSTTEDIINSVSCWLNYLCAIPMIVLGIIGAILTIIVFIKEPSFRRNSTVNYLLANAIMTAIHLPSIYLQSILVDGFNLGVFNTNDAACREHNYLLYVTTVPTILFPCWAAFDQYILTNRHATIRQRWNSMRFVRLTIIGTIIIAAIVYIPIIFISKSINNVCTYIDSPYTTFHNYVSTPLAYAVIPLILIVVFTYGTVKNLKAINFNNRQNRLTKQIRRMLIPQLIVLSVSGIPFGFQTVYLQYTNEMEKSLVRQAVEHLFIQIIRLFYHCNFVCTFYIYLFMSSEVRRILKRVIMKYLGKNVVSSTNGNIVTINLQTMKTSNP